MRIDSQFATLAASTAQPRRAGRAGARFEIDGPRGSARTLAARAAAPLATLDALLALQVDEDPAERRRRAARRGKDVLDALDGLKAALLGGAVRDRDLARITTSLAAATASGDPGLDAILAAVDLRARVELAKLRRAR